MEKYYYLLLDIGSFIVPFVYSFERKRIHFIQHWKSYFSAISLVGIFFIIWDIYFTKEGVWGFNNDYLIGVRFLKLPIEECFFFLLIPYASNFIHYALFYFFPKYKCSTKTAKYIAIALFVVSLSIAITNTDKIYTLSSFGLFAIFMLLQIIFKWTLFQRYILSFLVILIPFFMVNSILTGTLLEAPIVWYNNAENLGIRIGTIPIEDFFYCFSMLYSSSLLFDFFKNKI